MSEQKHYIEYYMRHYDSKRNLAEVGADIASLLIQEGMRLTSIEGNTDGDSGVGVPIFTRIGFEDKGYLHDARYLKGNIIIEFDNYNNDDEDTWGIKITIIANCDRKDANRNFNYRNLRARTISICIANYVEKLIAPF